MPEISECNETTSQAIPKPVKKDNCCNFCEKIFFKSDQIYICPKCHVKYCCLKCYKHPAHLQCTEAFYRDNCLAAMKEAGESRESIGAKRNKTEPGSENPIIRKLKELHTEDDADPEETDETSSHGEDSAPDITDLVREVVQDNSLKEEEVDNELAALGCGTDVESLLNTMTPEERKRFECLAEEFGVSLDVS